MYLINFLFHGNGFAHSFFLHFLLSKKPRSSCSFFLSFLSYSQTTTEKERKNSIPARGPRPLGLVAVRVGRVILPDAVGGLAERRVGAVLARRAGGGSGGPEGGLALGCGGGRGFRVAGEGVGGRDSEDEGGRGGGGSEVAAKSWREGKEGRRRRRRRRLRTDAASSSFEATESRYMRLTAC